MPSIRPGKPMRMCNCTLSVSCACPSPLTAKKEGYYLHIWKDEFPVREPFYPTHTHINHIDSRIIYGEMVNRIWEVVSDPDGHHKLMKTHYTADGSHQTTIPGNVSFSLGKEEVIPQDGIYTVTIGQFHESIAKGNVVILMRKYGFDTKARLLNVVSNEKKDEPHHFNHRLFSVERLWEIVDEVRGKLEKEIASGR